jgi:phasin family protein
MATSTKTSGKTTGQAAGKAAGTSGIPGLPSLDDLGKLLRQYKLPGVDVSAIIESQRKDLEALNEANRQAYEGIQALARRRNEILKEALAEWQSALADAAGKDALSKQAELAKKGIEQAVANFRELAQMEAETRSKAWKVLQDRFQENLGNLQKLLQPKK